MIRLDSQNYVYILANQNDTVLFTGRTNDLIRIANEQRAEFNLRQKANKLVYFEDIRDTDTASLREQQIKDESQERKLNLIQSMNPERKDLFPLL